MNNRLIPPRYYKALAGVAVAGVIAVSLTLLQQHRDTAKVKPASPEAGAPASSGNPTADRVHELKALEQDLQQKPEHPPILFRMAQLASELGKPADAIGYLQRLLKVEPGNTEARLELGRLLYATNDVPGALRETAKILETKPKQVDALYNLGAIYANLNNVATARTYWNRAVESDPASDSGKRAREGLEKLAATPVIPAASASAEAPHASGWTHPAVHP